MELWEISPALIDEPLERLLATLDLQERERARRMRPTATQRTYAIAHAGLRHLLAGRLGAAPAQLAFSRLPSTGKPTLTDQARGLTFNISHTHGLVLIALGQGCEVGVDVEWTGRRIRASTLSTMRFTPAEAAELAHAFEREHASEREYARCFLRIWTRREAHAKLTGEGLVRAMSYGSGDDGPFGGVRSWICDLALGPDHVGAIAVASHGGHLMDCHT